MDKELAAQFLADWEEEFTLMGRANIWLNENEGEVEEIDFMDMNNRALKAVGAPERMFEVFFADGSSGSYRIDFDKNWQVICHEKLD